MSKLRVDIIESITTGNTLTINSNITVGYVISATTFYGDGSNLTGISGGSGTSGENGSSGTSGLNGTTGSSGTNGTSGTSGLSGATGVSGSSGTSGTSGLSGATGVSGSSGTSGTRGTSGVNGSSGTSGITVLSGATGSSGTSGVNGTNGTSGVNGNVTITYIGNTYNVSQQDQYILADTTSNSLTIRLQHFDTPKEIYIKDYGGNANTLNISISADAPASLESGAPSKIQTNYGAVHFIYDNTNFTWRPISQYP